MSGPILYVTGTNTSVGKTTLAVLLLRHAAERGLRVGALKPFCSGGREDAERLHRLQTDELTLNEVNPFYFEDPVTPLVAARKAGKKISLQQTLNAIEFVRRPDFPLLIEGAGGLLSPLGEGFSLRDIIDAIPGKVCIVGTNSLGTLNLVQLTARCLPAATRAPAVALMNAAIPDASSETNLTLLSEFFPESNVIELPFLQAKAEIWPEKNPGIDRLLSWWMRDSSANDTAQYR